MGGLNEIVRTTMQWYVGNGRGANVRLFSVFDDEHQTYTVTGVDYPKYKATAGIVVLVRIVGDKVVIEEDTTDRPLLDKLLAQGIPREQIVLAYQGEPVPDPVQL